MNLVSETDKNFNGFSITEEECRQLHKEYEINDCIIYLNKAMSYVGGNTTIKDAIDKLFEMTRFKDEVKREMKKGLATTASAALEYVDSVSSYANIYNEKL